jgi:hypothetical protein
MKSILIILFLTVLFSGYSQNGRITGHLLAISPFLNTAHLKVFLKKGYMVMGETKTDSSGKFYVSKLSPGLYSLAIYCFRNDLIIDSIKIFKDSTTQLEIAYPGPCRYVYENGKKPECKEGHTDNIIPIVYGKPGPETMQKAEKGLVYLGGCMVTDCDPHYYCTIHKRKL